MTLDLWKSKKFCFGQTYYAEPWKIRNLVKWLKFLSSPPDIWKKLLKEASWDERMLLTWQMVTPTVDRRPRTAPLFGNRAMKTWPSRGWYSVGMAASHPFCCHRIPGDGGGQWMCRQVTLQTKDKWVLFSMLRALPHYFSPVLCWEAGSENE